MERLLRTCWRLIRSAPVALWAALLVLFAVIFIWRAQSEITQIGGALRTAHLRWLVALLVATAIIQALNAFKLGLLLKQLGCAVPYPEVVSAQLQRSLIATVVPAGSAPAAAVIARRFARFGVTTPLMVTALLLFSALGHISFIMVLIPVLTWISVTSTLSTGIQVAAIVFCVTVLLIGGATLWVFQNRRIPAWLQRRLPLKANSVISEVLAIEVQSRSLLVPLGIAVLVDVLGIGMLWIALRALDAGPTIATAAGGYIIGTLFLLIAPVFQGIGVVELSMAIALERAGISKSDAFGATLLYRLADVWSPLAVGIAIQIRAQERLRGLPRNLPAIMTGATGLLSVLSVMAPTIPNRFNRLQDYAFFDPHDASRTFSLVAGAVLLALSLALLRRRTIAWYGAAVLLLVLIASHLFKGHDQIVAVISAINLVVLLITRRRFRVRNDVPTMRRGGALLCASLAFALFYGTLGFWLLDRREFSINFSLWRSLKETVLLYFNLGGTDLDPHTRYADWFLDSVSVVGVISVLGAVISLLRPVVWRTRTLPSERANALALIDRYGNSALDEFKAWSDKIHYFSSDRQAVICYGVKRAVAVVLGDPVAPNRDAFQRVLVEFLDFCDANAWRIAFYQVGSEHLAEYKAVGLTPLKIGEDAIIDLSTWKLSGHSMKPFRAAVNRLTRDGYAVTYHSPPLPDSLVTELRAVSDKWLTLPGRRERQFTLGQWHDGYVAQTPVLTLGSSEGTIMAFINLVRDGVPGEATFDLMRHVPDAPNGSMDVLIVHLAERLQCDGYTRLSLGMVPFSAVGITESDPMLERGIRLLTERMERYFSYRGLGAYKEKFHPIWEPRYLLYQSSVALPQVALAIIQLTEGRS